VPRTWCRKDRVHQVFPGRAKGSGFSLMMEALVMLLSAQMPVDGIADLVQESDARLWRVLIHYIEQAQSRRNWEAVERIAVHETSARRRRGHRYVTNVLDCDGDGRRTQFRSARLLCPSPARAWRIWFGNSPPSLKGSCRQASRELGCNLFAVNRD
jgi:hypothetical protein